MKRKTIIYALLTCCVACGMLSCEDMDDYRSISGNEEIVYPGKIRDVAVKSGDGRLIVGGLCNSDPKVASCRIYWNLDADYVEVPVDMTTGSYLVEKEIELPENTYNFNIYTYDSQGNRSIPVNITGRSYGAKYKASITNRLVKSSAVQGDDVVIEWWDLDLTQGPFATEVVYTNRQQVKTTVKIPLDEAKTVLTGCDPASKVEYTTLYKPDETCVDVFRSKTDELVLAD